jgi:hypothetical protein
MKWYFSHAGLYLHANFIRSRSFMQNANARRLWELPCPVVDIMKFTFRSSGHSVLAYFTYTNGRRRMAYVCQVPYRE